jgi:Rad3-related DNA helicase
MTRNLQKYNPYPSFRKGQEEAINKIIDVLESDSYKNIVLEAPTGSGKSIIAYIVSAYMADNHKSKILDHKSDPYRTYLTTSLKVLMDQYDKEFGKTKRVAVIKGNDNYTCHLNNKPYTQGMCHSSSKKQSSLPCAKDCSYLNARAKARAHSITLSNFHYLLLEFDFVKKMGSRDLFIADEAHDVESIMMDYCAVTWDKNNINRLNSLIDKMNFTPGYPWSSCREYINTDNKIIDKVDLNRLVRDIKEKNYDEDLENIKTKALIPLRAKVTEVIMICEEAIKREIESLEHEGYSDNKVADFLDKKGFGKLRTEMVFFARLRCKISNFFDDVEKAEWIVNVNRIDNEIDGFEVKPVTVGFLTKESLTRMGNHRLFMSATICGFERFCNNIGLPLDETIFIEVPHSFPVENRPFVYIPIETMSAEKMRNSFSNIVKSVDVLLDNHKNEKGIIHSVSYYNANQLKNSSKHSKRFLIPNSENKSFVLKEFYNSKNKILVSPSIIEGLDLKDDLSRFQCFIKVPFLYLGDKQIKRRLEIDPDWYSYQAILSIIQGTGRSVRSETDTAVTYMLDKSFGRLLRDYDEYFPDSFKETIKTIKLKNA